MKSTKIISSLLLFIAATASMSAQQTFRPTEGWPYLYETFTQGILSAQNTPVAEGMFNIPVNGTKLHYIKDDKIMEIPAYQVKTLTIGNDLYITVSNSLMKVVTYSDNGYVLTHQTVDAEEMNSTEIGYGIKSNTTSAQSVNMTALGDIGVNLVNQNYMDVSPDRKKGKELPTETRTYIFVGNHLIEATKPDILRTSGVDKSEMNAFFKANNIKVKEMDSLLKIIDFIAEKK